jgi:hypothetical protein
MTLMGTDNTDKRKEKEGRIFGGDNIRVNKKLGVIGEDTERTEKDGEHGERKEVRKTHMK